ncbi:hypothetical protein B0H11DRAFT_2209846 [Mycena galericulata]|nr:hypothetical protein B0H11DRAFT_2209846 [Mycena galericulata]
MTKGIDVSYTQSSTAVEQEGGQGRGCNWGEGRDTRLSWGGGGTTWSNIEGKTEPRILDTQNDGARRHLDVRGFEELTKCLGVLADFVVSCLQLLQVLVEALNRLCGVLPSAHPTRKIIFWLKIQKPIRRKTTKSCKDAGYIEDVRSERQMCSFADGTVRAMLISIAITYGYCSTEELLTGCITSRSRAKIHVNQFALVFIVNKNDERTN